MQTPKDWRTYERHEISARYGDIKGQAWEDFRDGMTARSIKANPITTHEGKILDGWQRQRACVEKNVEPPYVVLRDGEDPETFVDRVNDHRRHDSAELVCAKAEVRRDRIIKARLEGKSIRAIAETEGIPKTTVEREVQGVTVPSGTVTGLDDREQPASKPKEKDGPTKKKARKKTSDNGKVIFDWSEFLSHYGYMVRVIGKFAGAHNCKGSVAPIESSLQVFKDKFTTWVEFHTKEKAPRH